MNLQFWGTAAHSMLGKLDDVQFARRDYQHRARVATLDGLGTNRWLTIPTHRPFGRATLIRDTLIAAPATARRRASSILRQQYGTSPHWPAIDRALQPVWSAFDTGRVTPVATASTRALLELLGWRGQIFTSSTLPARTGRSERLADLADVTGACAYLCGTGGMTYLDHAPFTELGVAVIPFLTPTTGLWASGRQVSALRALASRGPDAVGARFHALAFAHDALGCAA
ncbi:WbqC family protein [Streptomyces olivaceus]|nr:WbqC family protein [Streptomyces olivaceus]